MQCCCSHPHFALPFAAQALLGYELVNSGIGILFKQDVPSREICSIRLDQDSAKVWPSHLASLPSNA